jgi:hypothetical protein
MGSGEATVGELNRVQFGTHSSAPRPRPAGRAFNR